MRVELPFFAQRPSLGSKKILCARLKSKQFRFEPHKFVAAELTPLASEAVKPAPARECPVHMEARVIALHELKGEKLGELGGGIAAEVEVARVHVVR
jgi:flavin reductase (DIM6/NTAB) family NADH-FMN oxidoreductase RutF